MTSSSLFNQSTQAKTKHTEKPHSQEAWRALAASIADSDLSLAKYWEAHGIAASALYNGRKRFEEEAEEPSPFIEVLAPEEGGRPLNAKLLTDWRSNLSLSDGMILRIKESSVCFFLNRVFGLGFVVSQPT